ncbi:MAG: GDP-mannose 4,6-dehydratase [Candidatus Omnitrophica bacterium]|nr:GDP-mannose 4,6-dehydratase [Candidatus Omnitrophota bacterium]
MTKRQGFWKNKKVLITGFSGFLGSHLTRFLLNQGADITGLDIKTHRKMTVLTRQDLERIKTIKGSVEDYPLVFKIIKGARIEYVFHLAAKALVGECVKEPAKAFSTNIKGTWNILEASRNRASVKGVIVASSDKAYGSQKNLPYKEDCPLSGEHPYDVSKSCADLIAQAYFKTYGLPVCIVRCGNIFGPGDFNFSRIVPDAVRSAIQNKTLVIRSDGKSTRDYIYVEDVVMGYLILAQKMRKLKISGEAFNFSNELPLSVLSLVKMIYKLAGRESNYKILGDAHHEIRAQYLSAKKAHRILGWTPAFSLKKGLKNTIEWSKEYVNEFSSVNARDCFF